MRVELDIFGEQQIARKLLRVGEHAEDAAPAFRGIADYWRRIEVRQFNSQGETGSGGWKPLAAATIASKKASKDPKVRANAEKILVATGALRASLTRAGDEQHVERVTRDSLEFGTTVDYGAYHQLGRGVPQRRPVEPTETQRRESVRRLQRWLMTGELLAPSRRTP